MEAVDDARNVADGAPESARSARAGEHDTATGTSPPGRKLAAAIETDGPPAHATTSTSIASAVAWAARTADDASRWCAADCAAAELAACTCASVSTLRPVHKTTMANATAKGAINTNPSAFASPRSEESLTVTPSPRVTPQP